MVGETDNKDKTEARKIIIALIGLTALLAIATALILPLAAEFISLHFAPGLGLKSAAIIAFFVTIVLLIILTISAGDGLLGELQFIIGGFFLFFVIIWLMIAWVF